MTIACMLLTMFFAADEAPATIKERLQALHLQEAKQWRMLVGPGRREAAELEATPIYEWTNPTRDGGQTGEVYVWVERGRPVVVGSLFSYPWEGRRRICEEFHSLSEDLSPQRASGEEQWRPQAPVTLFRLPDAAAPDASAPRRLSQMRRLAREFAAHSVDRREERWQLRLLTQPLFRYQPDAGDVVDGALFAFVTTAGTDPEIMLALEARREGERLAWRYRLLRFSDSSLYVERGGKQVWTSVRDEKNELFFNADHTYRLICDKIVDDLSDSAHDAEPARLKGSK